MDELIALEKELAQNGHLDDGPGPAGTGEVTLTDEEIQILKWCQAVHFHVVDGMSKRDSYKLAGVSCDGFKTFVTQSFY